MRVLTHLSRGVACDELRDEASGPQSSSRLHAAIALLVIAASVLMDAADGRRRFELRLRISVSIVAVIGGDRLRASLLDVALGFVSSTSARRGFVSISCLRNLLVVSPISPPFVS